MSVWAARRQFTVLAAFGGIILLVVVGAYFKFFYKSPSCFDGQKNGAELDIDCGGGCARVCTSEADDVRVLWTRVFPVSSSIYDVASFIENPNIFGAERLSYHVALYDKDSVLVAERDGETFVNPDERFVIAEHSFNGGTRVPVRAFLTITDRSPWKRMPNLERPTISIQDKVLETVPRPRVSATVVNESLFSLKNVAVYALVMDARGNAIAVSTTHIASIDKESSAPVFFTWPNPFAGQASFVELYARVNMVTDKQ